MFKHQQTPLQSHYHYGSSIVIIEHKYWAYLIGDFRLGVFLQSLDS